MKKMSLTKIIILHLLPAFFMTLGVLILDYLISAYMIPRFLIFAICGICILVPVEIGVIKYYKSKEKSIKLIELCKKEGKRNWKQTIIFTIVSVVLFISVFGLLGPFVNNYIKETFFFWFPDAFNLGDYIENSQLYSRTILITSYFLGLLIVGIIIPVVEELYFRGFLLPRMGNKKFAAPFIETVLFAVYHFWSPWMIPIRILGIFPMVFFVSRKKNIYIGIITHVFLNIMGDFIFIIPIIFN